MIDIDNDYEFEIDKIYFNIYNYSERLSMIFIVFSDKLLRNINKILLIFNCGKYITANIFL